MRASTNLIPIISNSVRPVAIVVLVSALCAANLGAAPVTIADTPPLDINTVKPNLMFTIDDSGSMNQTFVPDEPPFMGQKGNFSGQKGNNCYKNHIANPMYFNPNITYVAPSSYDGATNTYTTLGDMSITAARFDGYAPTFNYQANGVTSNALLNLTTTFHHDWVITGGNRTGLVPAYYMVYNKAGVPEPGYCYGNADYTRVNVSDAAFTATQKANFANWFSYYRTRLLATKAAVGLAFQDLNKDEFRVGYHRISGVADFLDIKDFTGPARTAWHQKLYGNPVGGGTPLRAAASRVGEYYRTGAMPGVTGSIDPILKSCQSNYHILATDGYWNGAASLAPAGAPGNGPAGNNDDIVPVLPSPVVGLTDGAAWPPLYRQSTAGLTAGASLSGNLADIAAYYWATDLRTSGANAINNVPTNTKDPASWQHVVMFGVSIAAKSKLDFANRLTTTIPELISGVQQWPHPVQNKDTAIDDLWHAAVISRGNFFNVNNAQELASALTAALTDIASRSASAAGAALANPNLSSSSDNIAYVPAYKSGEWSGELSAKLLDSVTGASTTTLWRHSVVLDAQFLGTLWDTDRKMVTRASGATVPFRLPSLSAAQRVSLGGTSAKQQAVLNYLRGDKSEESDTSTYKFRQRATLLGDIVTSEPVVVDVPNQPYADSWNPGYSVFKAAMATRKPMVYFGANDGLFHAVDGSATGATAGKEMYAFVPSEIMRSDASGIHALAWRATDPPAVRFSHKYYVDGRISVRDVDFARTTSNSLSPSPFTSATTPNWKTILVSGLGKGGKSFFALDVTNAPTGMESETALVSSNRVLWEFTDADMGFSYALPGIVKSDRYGWVVILTSGYNNTAGANAGKGFVYIVDVKTGVLLHKFKTPPGDGSATDPLGLAQINAFVQDSTKFTGDFIYGGDLYGNFWRFDMSADSTANYPSEGVKLAKLTDGAGKLQPVTSPPSIFVDRLNRKRYVTVGTGKLFAAADVTNIDQQTVYNIADGNLTIVNTLGLPITRSMLTNVARTDSFPPTVNASGWLQDLLANSGERVLSEFLIAQNLIVAASTTPSLDPCNRGGIGTLYAREGATAKNRVGGGTTFVGGTATSPPIVGKRVIRTSDKKTVVQISQADQNITTIAGIVFPGGFTGTVANYREILD